MKPCPGCSQPMELGSTHAQGRPGRQVWFRGDRQSHVSLVPPRFESEALYRIDVWRCTACGLLQAYAKERV